MPQNLQNDATAFANIAFIDAYFSNFIEGAEFEIDEAMEIVFQNITLKCSSMEMISPELTGIGQLRWNGFLNLL